MDPLSAMFQPAASLVGSLFSSGANMFNTQQQNQMNQQMQQQAENYNTQMSNTAYQRATADMKAAGLNPMMMFGSGSAASTPQIAPAQMSSAVGAVGDAVQKGINSAVQMKTANATIDNLVQQNANLKADQAVKEADVTLKGAQFGESLRRQDLTNAQTDIVHQQLHGAVRDALNADNEAEFLKTDAGKLLSQTALAGNKAADTLSPISSFVSSANQARRLMAPWDLYHQ